MANITIIQSKTDIIDLHGMGQFRVMQGEGQFNGTDTSDTMKVPGMNRISSYFFNAIGGSASDGPISLADTEKAGFVVPVKPAYTVTVQRAAGTTSGLPFKFMFIERL